MWHRAVHAAHLHMGGQVHKDVRRRQVGHPAEQLPIRVDNSVQHLRFPEPWSHDDIRLHALHTPRSRLIMASSQGGAVSFCARTRGISRWKMKVRSAGGAIQRSSPLTWQCTCRLGTPAPSKRHSASTSSLGIGRTFRY